MTELNTYLDNSLISIISSYCVSLEDILTLCYAPMKRDKDLYNFMKSLIEDYTTANCYLCTGLGNNRKNLLILWYTLQQENYKFSRLNTTDLGLFTLLISNQLVSI